jgi:hypothetical protein
MAGEAKTRVAVQTEHGLRELFSVREHKSKGDLYLITRCGTNHEDEIKGDISLIGERFTVHPSDESSGTTIKRTAPLADGRHLTTAAFVEGPKDQLFVPLWAQYAPKLDLQRYECTPRSKDTVHVLADYNETGSTLLYFVFATSKTRVAPNYPDNAGQKLTIEFRCFNIVVYFAFINLGAMPWYDMCVTSSGPEQDTLTPTKQNEAVALTFLDHHTVQFVDDVARQLSEMHWKRLHSFLDGSYEDAIVQDLHGRSKMVLARPLEAFSGHEPLVFSSHLPSVGSQCVVVKLKEEIAGKIYLS